MIRAKHTIMVPERVILPGELVTLPDGEEPRLIAAGFATAVEPHPQAEATRPAPAPDAPSADPSDPPDRSDLPAPPPPPQPAVCKTRRPK